MRKIYLGLLAATLFHLNAIAQQQVSGKVTNARNEPLRDASVIVKTTSRGLNTNELGEFSIQAAPTDSLEISYTGYESKSVLVGDSKILSIVLNEVANSLSDVVVVAYGTQKKKEIVGSVTSINPEDLKIPSSNLTTALAGRLAGVIAYQRSGEPGADNADFFIRGVTTFGYKKDPLILIDGIELTSTDLARLNPNDIASFSIMKDATSTALYGARGANGVVLVTTKQGKVGKAKIMLNAENSVSMPTRNVELADPVTYMKLHNEAILTRDPTQSLYYSQDKIDNTGKEGSNPYIYPATDWRKELFKEYAVNQRANLNVSGGGTVARYYVSGTFAQDNGVLKVDKRNNFNNNINLKTYSLRSNVNINIFPSTELIVRLAGIFDDYTGPIYSGADMYARVMRSNPVLFPAYYPIDSAHAYVKHIMFGNYETGNFINPYADMVKGYRNYTRSNMNAQLELKQNLDMITKGLKVRGRFNTARISYFDVARQYKPFYYQLTGYNTRENIYSISEINPGSGMEALDYNEGAKDINSTVYMEAALDYSRSFDKHSLSGMLVYTRQEILKANAGSLQTSLPARNMGLAGRATYGFDSRYYLEFNFGYNGSERFYKTHRWGFFPSAGFAWNVSNEKFMQNLSSIVSNLKLRGTYGVVGNDAIGAGRFLYLSDVNLENTSTGAVFGKDFNYVRPGISISRYADQNITWETAQKANLAIELGLFNKFNIIAEYFNEHRKNILQTRASVPGSMGLWSLPATNYGEARGRGFDLSVDYNHNFNSGLWLKGIANFTYASSKFLVYDQPDYGNNYWRSRIGYPLSQTWGYIGESLFTDDAEVRSSPQQSFGGTVVLAGDIKYRDINNDGVITTLDMVPIGFPTQPEIIYGFGISAGYKNFDISTFFQGLARESFWIDPVATAPFVNNQQLLKVYADSYWSEDNPNIYALWPRLSSIAQPNNTQTNTWFMRNGSFLRLKQVELGYTLPSKIASRAAMSSLRIYANGLNLFTWSKFKLWDVEMAGNGLRYPIQKVFNLGLMIGFN